MSDNGRLSDSELAVIPGTTHRVRKELMPQTAALRAAFSRKFGKALGITDSYRSYATQADLFRKRYTRTYTPGINFTPPRIKVWNGQNWYQRAGTAMAATPGTSNHGWGAALDFSSGVNVMGSAEHKWMVANAPRFGWTWPAWAGPAREAWHFEARPVQVSSYQSYLRDNKINVPTLPELNPLEPEMELSDPIGVNPATKKPSNVGEALDIAKNYSFYTWEQNRKIAAMLASQQAQITNLIGAINALSNGEPFDETRLREGIKTDVAEAVREAVGDSLDVDVIITPKS